MIFWNINRRVVWPPSPTRRRMALRRRGPTALLDGPRSLVTIPGEDEDARRQRGDELAHHALADEGGRAVGQHSKDPEVRRVRLRRHIGSSDRAAVDIGREPARNSADASDLPEMRRSAWALEFEQEHLPHSREFGVR
jgi:hypothetical protein